MGLERVVAAWGSLPAHVRASIEMLVDAAAGAAAPAPVVGGYVYASTISVRTGLTPHVLRRHLKRWRQTHDDASWISVADAKATDAKYLYDADAVWPLVEKLTAAAVRRSVRREK